MCIRPQCAQDADGPVHRNGRPCADMSGAWGSANIAGTRVSSGSADRAGTGGAASTSSGPRATADGRTSGVRRCWCSVGVAEPEGCARWPGSHALTSRNAADGVQHLWSLGLCADGMGLSGLDILALCALLGFIAMKMEFPVVSSLDLSKVKVGDKVRFTITGLGNSNTVQSISPAR